MAHERVVAQIERPDVELHIPTLCDAEVLSGLRSLVRRQTLARRVAEAALDAYLDLPVVRHADAVVLGRALRLESVSAYDAIYVALAERLAAPLLTTDERLARAVAGTRDLRVVLA